MRLVCISDTHNQHHALQVPEGDVLIHAGDLTMRGKRREMEDVVGWLAALPHAVKVVVAGNHDWIFQKQPEVARQMMADAGLVYLQDTALEVGGLRFWGSPWQPWMMSWAFNLTRGEALRARWDLIPAGTDVLVTHSPPYGIGDQVEKLVGRVFAMAMRHSEHVGCEELREAVRRVKPRVHVFGHIHEGYGIHEEDGTTFVNPSSCDMGYRLSQAPLVVDVEPR